MATINAYVTFNGNCHEAMTFYKECFGGELISETIKGSPMESHWPKEVQDNILHSSLVSKSITILASDMVEQNGLTIGNNVTLALICKTDQEIELYFNKLSKDGTIKYPLHNFYNGKIGAIIDKFGINWFLKL
jgi:PhnB protein